MTSHLFALGGGGYYGPQGGPNRMLMEVLRTTGKRFPKICLIPTASADRPEAILEFVQVFNRMNAHPNYLSLYAVPTRDIESFVMDFDAVFVSGGNTRNLMALWREWELDRIMTKAWRAGVVISGSSAGANCWFEQSSSDYIPGEFNPIAGFGLVKGSCCPHYADEKGRRASFIEMVKSKRIIPGYGISDRAAVHYVDGQMAEALVEHDLASVCRLQLEADGSVSETKIPARTVAP